MKQALLQGALASLHSMRVIAYRLCTRTRSAPGRHWTRPMFEQTGQVSGHLLGLSGLPM
ncbi:MAG: hypothetical protein MJE77_13775 [Proteobacteria bacterium]|nr:hypothetical protein [Pseudomonadota bacterium]